MVRFCDEEYKVGEIWIDKDTDERYVCIDVEMQEDEYYDEVVLVTEEYYLKVSNSFVKEDDLENYTVLNTPSGFDDFEWLKGVVYDKCKCIKEYYFGK